MAFVGSSVVPLLAARPPAVCTGLARVRPLPTRAAVRASPLVMKDKAKRKPRKPSGSKRARRVPPPAAADAAAVPDATPKEATAKAPPATAAAGTPAAGAEVPAANTAKPPPADPTKTRDVAAAPTRARVHASPKTPAPVAAAAKASAPVAAAPEASSPAAAEAPAAPLVEVPPAPIVKAPVRDIVATAAPVATSAKVPDATIPTEAPAEDLFPEPTRADTADDTREPVKAKRGQLLPPWATEIGGIVLVFILSLVVGGILTTAMGHGVPVPGVGEASGPSA